MVARKEGDTRDERVVNKGLRYTFNECTQTGLRDEFLWRNFRGRLRDETKKVGLRDGIMLEK